MSMKASDLPPRYQRQIADQLAEGARPDFPERREPIRIWLPGLKLPSVNLMQSPRSTRDLIEKKKAAKNEARNALRKHAPALHRVPVPVAIRITQFAPSHRMDAENISTKHLIDAITVRGGGVVDILPDDGPRFVREVTRALAVGELGVEVLISPMGVN